MPKTFSKFNSTMKNEFPFLKPVAGSESEVLCTFCDGKFSVADGGRTRIKAHINTQKHIKSSKIVSSNQAMADFLAIDTAKMQLQGKELAFAYHAGRHRSSKRTADCNSKMINKCFDVKFSCGATKSTKLVQKVSVKQFVLIFLFGINKLTPCFVSIGDFTGN